VLLDPGDVVLVESPTYAGALDLFRSLGLRVVGAPLDEDGLIPDELEPLLQQHHPRLVYTIPNFQNPTGTCMSGPRRRRLIELADRYNVPILEDDFVGDLRYEGRAQPTLKTLDPGGRVLYVSTFSKMLMPGLRVGFLVADGPVLGALAASWRASALATASLTQHALEEYVTVGRYRAHLGRCRQLYRRRRDAMLDAIARDLPGTSVARAHGGLFLWLRLPPGRSADALLGAARARGVDFAPGSRFHPEGGAGREWLRLNFATLDPERIEAGIRRLAEALEDDGSRG
jgi:GntR family transcriptional regulator/MocR family aminotransferase